MQRDSCQVEECLQEPKVSDTGEGLVHVVYTHTHTHTHTYLSLGASLLFPVRGPINVTRPGCESPLPVASVDKARL